MNIFTDSKDFYPTPKTLLSKICEGIDWCKVKTVLEPSAGKGNIVEHVLDEALDTPWGRRSNVDVQIDCIEKNKELQSLLKGKGYRVIHDDFLTFHTNLRYDLIIMNPPFSNGDAHLLKAIELQEKGGAILCILNAETLLNPYTTQRQILVRKIKELNGTIEYKEEEFIHAERPTKVKVAIVKLDIPKKESVSLILEELQKKEYQNPETKEASDIALADYIEDAIAHYNLECSVGIRLIEEYQNLYPYIQNSLLAEDKYKHPLLQLRVCDSGGSIDVNLYVKKVRMKYWEALFENPKFTRDMTNAQREDYRSKVNELKNYDFNFYNIKTLQIEMKRNLVKGIEDVIMTMFNDFTDRFSYYQGCEKNIHYINGWKSNKCWIINKKVISPIINAYSHIWKVIRPDDYNVVCALTDYEKALSYLDTKGTPGPPAATVLRRAKELGQTKNIHLKYFTVTFYKKGTCHIEFTDPELLKKLNIFGAQNKGWLPPSYGKRHYSEMTPEEQNVVNEFDGGAIRYEQILADADYYIYNPEKSLNLLEMSA